MYVVLWRLCYIIFCEMYQLAFVLAMVQQLCCRKHVLRCFLTRLVDGMMLPALLSEASFVRNQRMDQ